METLSQDFLTFAAHAQRDGSPLYARLARGVAEDAEMLALAAGRRPGQPAPNLLFGAMHALLLAGMRDPLGAFYASLTPSPREPAEAGADDPYPLFRAVALERRAAIGSLLRTRLVQTNEVRRCACLLPAFEVVARLTGGQPLALVEIGASAGLNLLWDRYSYEYGVGRTCGDLASPLHLSCAVHGVEPPLPAAPPRVAWRVGLDLNPVDVCDAEAVRWLRALTWPEHTERADLLERAAEVVRADPPRLLAGDALDRLLAALAESPGDATLCVFHSIVLYQFTTAQRARLDALIARASVERDIYRVSLEPHADDLDPHLCLIVYRSGARVSVQPLARCQTHGAWIEWGG